MPYELGSTWRKWDLHIHTPASGHAANYGGDAWDRFLSELAALPPEISVIGINDYIWVDGYQRVLEARAAGHLPNIEAVFPVIELRLDDFVGTDSRLQRVNAHVIFAPATEPERIDKQFIASLVNGFSLTDEYQKLKKSWKQVPTREAIAELGALIKASVPEDKRGDFKSDLVEGFNNWVIPLAAVKEAMQLSAFDEIPLLAMGKTEWEDMQWNNHTIATKKSLISNAQLVFTAAETATHCNKAVQRLRTAGVNHRLLDCSDAHNFTDSKDKDRLGNCFTWICADPTLAGLKHALIAYDSRVFIGDKPPLLLRAETDSTRFISSARITPVNPNQTPGPSFDVTIPINPGFIAVIGNKGSGKSALLDSIALASNSHSEERFTFLHKQRYRDPKNNLAKHYQIALTTADGASHGPIGLNTSTDLSSPERIRYLPQTLLEALCNKEPGAPDDAFEAELRSIIFSHVPEHQRLGSRSLDELLERRGEALDHEIEHRREKLADISRQRAALEERLRETRLASLKKSEKALQEQITQHEASKPSDPIPPPENDGGSPILKELNDRRLEIDKVAEEKAELEGLYSQNRAKLDSINNLSREIDVLESRYADFVSRAQPLADEIHIALDKLATLKTNQTPLDALRIELTNSLDTLKGKLGPDATLAQEEVQLQQQIKDLQSKLDAPRRMYEKEKQALAAWNDARSTLIGDETTEGTLKYVQVQIAEYESLDGRRNLLRLDQVAMATQIHGLLLQKVDMYRELHEPVQEFVRKHQLAQEQFSLEFEANLEIKEFLDRYVLFIDRSVAGTYYGKERTQELIDGRVKTLHPAELDSVLSFIDEHDKDLHSDRRPATPPARTDSPSDMLRKEIKLEELYDYLYGLSYLDAVYELKSEGRSISQLSPGQKGTILLMFYLLVDRSGRPIALDQPDENLDNHTISALLSPAIAAAKGSRQVFIVTHSPNLAVVGDADQVIIAQNDGAKFSYQSGSIENPTIRNLVLEVLEGKWEAFDDRLKKYQTTEVNSES